MTTRVVLLLIIVGVLGAGGWAIMSVRNQPPEVPFAKVMREEIASSVPTNGKVEPIEWAEARAEQAGQVRKILIQKGDRVAQGAPLIEFDSNEARAELAAAQARISQAHADLDVIERGGRASDLTAISSQIESAKFEIAAAQKEYDVLARLQAKQAATSFEVAQAKEKVERAQLQIHALEQRRAALIAPPDRSAAQARLDDAESAVTLAQDRIRKSVVRAPVAGTVYQFDLKQGAYLNPGDLVAAVGRLDRVRVKVFVDEPDLGRVSKAMPVVITWDAMPGRTWKGAVDKTPTQIVALGTRQVGEVLCVIDNPGGELLPGTNVNVEIQAEVISNALTIPKEAVRHELGQTGVYTLSGQTAAWKKVELGVASTTRTQVEGLKEGDAVALASAKPLRDGMIVNPEFP
jgi:HlyD family secretion protein